MARLVVALPQPPQTALRPSKRLWLAAPLSAALISVTAVAAPIAFKNALTDAPMDVQPRPGEVETDAVKQFKETGENPYRGNADAIADGKRLYTQNCAVCHNPDGAGKMGPTLIGTDWTYPRAGTDVGMFEVIYGGASGAMQSFAKRGMSEDNMLKVIAYVRTLAKP